MRWCRQLPSIEKRLGNVLASWLKTPYVPGQRVRGVGVDCKEFILGVLDEMYRQSPSPTVRLAPDLGSRDARLGVKEIHRMLALYPDVQIVRDGTIQPGDVIVTRSADGFGARLRPGHAMIVGLRPFEAFHAMPPRSIGVVKSSLSATRSLVRVYRPGRKGDWA